MKSKAQKRRERRHRVIQKHLINSIVSSSDDHLHSLLSNNNSNNNYKNESIEDSILNGIQVKWSRETIPSELVKYYHQRYSLFHKFDSCWIDYEGFYSVTPEVIAKHTATRLKNYNVVDGFCGVGGNAIQFALAGSKVLAIELNETRLACARHNAIVYGVEELITFVHGDFLEL